MVSALDCYAEGHPSAETCIWGTATSHHRSTSHQEVGSCHTRGETQGISCMPPPSVDKAAHSGGFEIQRRHHQKSKTEVSVAPQNDMCPPKHKRKKLTMKSILFN